MGSSLAVRSMGLGGGFLVGGLILGGSAGACILPVKCGSQSMAVRLFPSSISHARPFFRFLLRTIPHLFAAGG